MGIESYEMICFYLNDKLIRTDNSPNTILLDFIRSHQKLNGTKIGCREGDCGACTVLVGSINPESHKIAYKSVTSCLTPLANIHNKHIVTIEGINRKDINKLTPVQQSFVEQGASQCGFCTPGLIMSATGFFLPGSHKDNDKLVDQLDGNICRCTGYKSIERACTYLTDNLNFNSQENDVLPFAVSRYIIPEYFLSMEENLKNLIDEKNDILSTNNNSDDFIFVGGGTDLLVQKSDEVFASTVVYTTKEPTIIETDEFIIFNGSVTTEEFFESQILHKYIKQFNHFKKLVASTPIRNMGTLAGNIANASPIGDLTIILLALDAIITVTNGNNQRNIPLKDFYRGYKTLAKDSQELITEISIPKKLFINTYHFNFEKVSKRTNLDIASVNTAIFVEVGPNNFIENVYLSAGGIAPIPTFLTKTCQFLLSKKIDSTTIATAIELARDEVTPISDVRGSKEYKLLLLAQLLLAHFLQLFPNILSLEEVYN